MLKKISCLLLIAIMLATLFVACGNTGTDESSGTSSSKASTSDTESTETDQFNYEANFDDITIKIACAETLRHKYGELQFVPNPELSTNVINTAIAERNNFIKENFGITIQTVVEKFPSDLMENQIASNISDFDIICESVDRVLADVTMNYYLQLDDILNLDDPWWNKKSNDLLSLDGEKHYFVSGDGMLTDKDNIYMYLFNKTMYDENTDLQAYGSLYDIVNEGRFTIDLMMEMSKLVSKPDINGEWGFNATYGNLSHAHMATVMFNGCGLALATTDENGDMRLTLDDEKSYNVFDKIYQLMSDKKNTQRAELIAGQGATPSQYGFSELEEMFLNKRGMFYSSSISSVTILKDKPDDYGFKVGVLPLPKYDEQQTEYYGSANRYHSTVFAIPSIAENVEEAAFLLNALGYYNTHAADESKTVFKAYYETTLKTQAIETDEDAAMLDLIFDNVFYDIGSFMGWAENKMIGLFGSIIADDTANLYTSKWEAMRDAVQDDMDAMVEAYREMD